ncbi:hypothetical protein GQ55_7G077700 [Panicum hallii var. hallii]|uniref:Uncharacterized protein n=1 Tax=Panicum hallii var. hallii TaxID=1504633 RepID=A0A2T7CSZ1_9POAL|nr:hypothetical protein GQ55_7G077700 [Panicum hallii var. hallii]
MLCSSMRTAQAKMHLILASTRKRKCRRPRRHKSGANAPSRITITLLTEILLRLRTLLHSPVPPSSPARCGTAWPPHATFSPISCLPRLATAAWLLLLPRLRLQQTVALLPLCKEPHRR